MENIKKRGAIEMEYIIVAIVLIIAFIGLTYVLIRANIQGLGPDVACKLSILAKATAPGLLVVDPKASIPIECVTKKICLGGKCKDNFDGEKDVVKVDLKNNPEKDLPVIEKTVADAFYNCWNDMGRGKLDLFGSSEDAKPRCIVCSRIALEKNLDFNITERINVNKYMKNHNPGDSKLNYLESMGLQSEKTLNFDSTGAVRFGRVDGSDRKTSEVAVVFMQVSAESGGKRTLEYTGVAALGAYALNKVGRSPAGLPLVGRSYARMVYIPLKKVVSNVAKSPITIAISIGLTANAEINAWADRILVAGYCGTYENTLIGGKGSEGCSLLQIVPYDKYSINSMCNIIEAEV